MTGLLDHRESRPGTIRVVGAPTGHLAAMPTEPAPEPAPEVDRWGVQATYLDAHDQPCTSPAASVEAVRALVGEPPADLDDVAPLVVRPGSRTGLGRVEVRCEDGEVRTVDDVVPDDFPLGYHRVPALPGPAGSPGEHLGRLLVVSPGRCHVPEQRAWGWTVQLYAARSTSSWGVGDLGDLASLVAWTRHLGGGFVLVNPLHAVAPTLPQESSPYLPATRRWRNPVHLDVARAAGVTDDDLAEVADEVAGLQASELVDRDGAWRTKRRVLERACARTRGDVAFTSWRAEAGPSLDEWSRWAALAERHGPDLRAWPEGLHRDGSEEVATELAGLTDAVTFHAWLQWQLDVQLREAAGGGVAVLQDLPIGVSGGGADAWAWPDVVARGATVGAPPDLLNSLGQDWGSPPFVPWRLREAEYAPFVESLRGTLAGAGGLRIDHVMGLFRLWWVPQGSSPADGAYVRYPADDLLDLVALESHRAGAVVVGEDLGTVEPGVREALAERGVLSYRVLWFEDDEPADWPALALGAVTTHDLPTVAGAWTGSDAADQAATTGMDPADVEEGRAALVERLREAGARDGDDPAAVVDAAYDRLAEAPCLLLSLSLEDAVGEERRPNVPGTGPEDRPNWCLPLPVAVDDLVAGRGAGARAGALARRVGGRLG